ncbi:HYC_CC_PP family protein [Salegentibacter sp. HM20]
MKLVSIFLSLLVLLSTSTVSLDAHYCSDSLQDLAINKKAKSCSSEVAVESKKDFEDTCCS